MIIRDMSLILILLLFFNICFVCSTTFSQRYENWDSDTDILISFYKETTKAGNWINSDGWLEPNLHHCQWFGITCSDNIIKSINLPSNGLEGKIPSTLGDLLTLELINLSHNKLSGRIPADLGKLQHLHSLILSFNSLEGFSSGFSFEGMDSLALLDVQKNLFESFPDSISGVKETLNVLIISENFLLELPNTIESFTKLNYVDASKNKGLVIPTNFWTNVALTELYLNDIGLKELPTEIGQLVLLETLQLEDNDIQTIEPQTIGLLTALKVLYLSNNLINSIPSDINNLMYLEELDLNQNNLVQIPVLTNPSLKVLKILDNQINYLDISQVSIILEELQVSSEQLNPSTLSSFYNLKSITFYDRRVTSIPSLPPNLEQIHFINVNISSWPSNSNQMQLTSLKSFSFLNNIRVDNEDEIILQPDFPSWVLKAQSLMSFTVSGVKGSLPTSGWSSLNSLLTVRITDCPKLTGKLSDQFPGSLASLTSLELTSLPSLSGELPPNFHKISKSLISLIISNTGITDRLDDEDFDLNSIKYCYLDSSNFTCYSESLLRDTLCTITCDGDTISGNWVTDPDTCFKVPHSGDQITYFSEYLSIEVPNQFEYFVEIGFSCNNVSLALFSVSGTLEIIDQKEVQTNTKKQQKQIQNSLKNIIVDENRNINNKINKNKEIIKKRRDGDEDGETDSNFNKYLLNVTFHLEKRKMKVYSKVFADIWSRECTSQRDGEVILGEIYDISNISCVLNPTNIELVKLEDMCNGTQNLNHTLYIDFSSQTLAMLNAVGMIFYEDCDNNNNNNHNNNNNENENEKSKSKSKSKNNNNQKEEEKEKEEIEIEIEIEKEKKDNDNDNDNDDNVYEFFRRGYRCPSLSMDSIICNPICGDKLNIGSEQCDDGNNDNYDGCSSFCQIEKGWSCKDVSTRDERYTTITECKPICDDGLIVSIDDCDSKNVATTTTTDTSTDDGDGKSDATSVVVGVIIGVIVVALLVLGVGYTLGRRSTITSGGVGGENSKQHSESGKTKVGDGVELEELGETVTSNDVEKLIVRKNRTGIEEEEL